MNIKQFIENFREAFGEAAGLPVAFWYSDEPVAATPKIEGCFFKGMRSVRDGQPMSLNADNIGCGGGRFYTGFAPMGAHVPTFVSLKEKYKETPEMVVDHIERSEVPVAAGKYLNLARIDTFDEIATGGEVGRGGFDGIEGLIFFATPDILSGLTTWAWFDNNADDAVTTRFGSGCSTIIADPVRENRCGGRRTFIGCFDVSVRPFIAPDELSFTIPMSRFREMLGTMRSSSLFGTSAWQKIRHRIDE
jgi:hypothetical protein